MIEVINEEGRTISYEVGEDYINITNNYEDNIRIEFIIKNLNYGRYVTNLSIDMYTQIDLNQDTWKNQDLIITISTRKYCYVYLFDGKEKKMIRPNKSSLTFSSVKNPIIVTGHTGGGTSILFKFLVSRGLYRGIDNGNFNRRKPLESPIFRVILNSINDHNTLESVLNNTDMLTNSVRANISDYFDIFWGNEPYDLTWGFKKPSLGISSIIISNVFPDAKVVSVSKGQDGPHTTKEGSDFARAHITDVIYQQRPLLEGNRVFHVTYEKFFEDYHYANKLLRYCELKEIPNQNDFEKTLDLINYER